jgi:hypothetical protein
MIESIASMNPLTLFFGAVFALLAVLSPKAALVMMLPVIALAGEMQIGSVTLRPDDLLMTILALSWMIRRLGHGRAPTPLDRLLWAYFGVGLIATLWGAAIGTADLRSLAQYSASGLHLIKRLEFVLFFFILTDTLRSVDDVRRLTYVLMASLAGLSLYSLGRFYETGSIALAPVGAAIHEPGLAAMLNVGLALGILVASRRVVSSVLSGSVLLGSLWVLPFSLGRNFIWSTLAMLGLVGFSRKRALLLLLPLAWIVAPLVLPETVSRRAMSIRYAFSETPSEPVPGAGLYVPERFGPGLRYGAQVIGSSPIFGWGLGSVALGSIDSEYANQFVSTGIVGFLIFVVLLVRIYRMTRETAHAAHALDSPALPYVVGVQNCLLGYALYSLFSPSISAARAGAFFFTILGLMAVLHRELARETATASEEAPGAAEGERIRYPYRPGRPAGESAS